MKLSYLKENALNAICPYFTMFPLEYPFGILSGYQNKTTVVLDPFCGRGTTLFAARTLGLQSWGIDSSPVAVAIAKAKLASCDIEEPMQLARKLILEVEPKEIPDTPFFRAAYNHDTLRDICALREGILNFKSENDASVILRATILGCLHGPLSKNKENVGYLSNQMLRTYASKPDYAVRFWDKKGLKADKIDVLRVLRRKMERLTGVDKISPSPISRVLYGDAQSEGIFKKIKQAPSVVITSPPYFGMRTYVQDQWLRNWFLGGPAYVDYSTGPQLDQKGPDAFARSLGIVWRNIANCSIASESLQMFVRFGIIPSAAVNAKEIFKKSLKESGIPWRLVSCRTAKSAHAGKRQADQMKVISTAAMEFDFHVERM